MLSASASPEHLLIRSSIQKLYETESHISQPATKAKRYLGRIQRSLLALFNKKTLRSKDLRIRVNFWIPAHCPVVASISSKYVVWYSFTKHSGILSYSLVYSTHCRNHLMSYSEVFLSNDGQLVLGYWQYIDIPSGRTGCHLVISQLYGINIHGRSYLRTSLTMAFMYGRLDLSVNVGRLPLPMTLSSSSCPQRCTSGNNSIASMNDMLDDTVW